MNNLKIVKDFFRAHNERDADMIRSYLGENFSYRSPTATFNSPDDFIKSLKPMLSIIKNTEIIRSVSEGNSVVVHQKLTTTDGSCINETEAIEWYVIDEGKIVELFFMYSPSGFRNNDGNNKLKAT